MLYQLLRPLFFSLDPEKAHEFGLRALKMADKLGLLRYYSSDIVDHPVTVMGIEFPSRVGLAAGLDKNGEYFKALAALGFGFVEIGTVTPRPQAGNPKPRLFRIPEKQAIINRMGFNNKGVDYLVAQVRATDYKGVLGINIGKNADTPMEKAVDDYLLCLDKVYPVADYVTINISSPNTRNLRELQRENALRELLQTLKNRQQALQVRHQRRVPLVVKIAPDLNADQVATIAKELLDVAIDGVIATNTTVSRPGMENHPLAKQSGGLSGAPLMPQSTWVVRELNSHLQGRIPIIAAGGIMSAEDALEKIAAGASLVQIYTGLIYQGPELIKHIRQAL